jgi:hypothetical protein
MGPAVTGRPRFTRRETDEPDGTTDERRGPAALTGADFLHFARAKLN